MRNPQPLNAPSENKSEALQRHQRLRVIGELPLGVIDVRRFDVATHFARGGDLEVTSIWLSGEDTWDIDLAEVVKVNALAVPADRELTYQVMQHELRLLLSFLVDEPGNPLSLRHTEFYASSAHVKRFISESFGLGMLSAAAERHHRWKLSDSDLHHFDVLPANVIDQYSSSGIRPDLLFDFADQGQVRHLAGEARGRSSVRPVYPVSKEQRDRLASIVAWSGWNDLHPVTMTYAYTGAANAQVDLFVVTGPGDKADVSDGGHRELVFTVDVVDEDRPLMALTNRQFERLESIRPRAVARAGEIAGQLYATAPQGGPARSVYGRNVRGSWATADLVASSRLRFFLGLLDQPLTPEQAGTPRRRRNASIQQDADPIQVAATGRVLAVVARDAGQDPDWSEVTGRLE